MSVPFTSCQYRSVCVSTVQATSVPSEAEVHAMSVQYRPGYVSTVWGGSSRYVVSTVWGGS
eukprot:1296341-Rhodomonas_salina.2